MAIKENGFLQTVKDIIGKEFVFDDSNTIFNYSRTTLTKNVKPAAVLKPNNTRQIKKIVDEANKFNIQLYPISKGKNWGYGSACGVFEDQVIMDLSRMDRIIEVNEKLAYAVIEPGVTQIQLYNYLKQNRIPLMLDCTGSGPEASIVGNTLERGFGHTPYGDHFLHSCGMEILLGDGRSLNTGFGHYESAKSTNVFKYGIGPYLDGVFTQSNFGIVLKLGIWLMPLPESCSMFYCAVQKDEALSDIIEALRPLKLTGRLKSLIHCREAHFLT